MRQLRKTGRGVKWMKGLKSVILLMMPALAATGHAETVVVDLLSYDINTSTNEATVTGPASTATEIHDLVIPDVVTVFGNEYKVTAVGEGAFANNTQIKGSLTIGNNVKEIGAWAFSRCEMDGELKLGNSLEIINRYAFYYNQFTGFLIIPDSVKKIGSVSFRQSGNFSGDLIIPDSVRTIETEAFDFNSPTHFDKLVIGKSVEKIGNNAFDLGIANRIESLNLTPPNGSGLTHSVIYVPVECVDSYRNAEGWKENQILGPNDIPVSDITLDNSKVEMIVGENIKLTATISPDDASDKSISWTSSDETILTVDENGVMTGIAPGFVTVRARSTCAPYISTSCDISVSKGMIKIGNIKYGIIENGDDNNLCAKVLGGDPTIDKSIIIADEIEYEGKTYKVTEIERGAFSSCSDFTGTLTLGKNIQIIGSSAFSRCEGLTGELIIPNSVKSIGKYAFRVCGFTGPLTIPESVTEIGERAFQECKGLSGTLDIQGPIEVINQFTFHLCIGITRVVLPETLKRIEDYAFRFAGLKGALVIPNSVTYIGNGAFMPDKYKVDALLLGNSLDVISPNAFYTDLKIVQTLSETPVSIRFGTFRLKESNVLYVPKGSLEAYKAAEGWNEFAEIRETDDIMTLEIELGQDELELTTGESTTLATIVYPEMATNKQLTWSSSDESVAMVNASGEVTAMKKGIAVITATAADGSGTTATCTVTVSPRKVTVDNMTYEVIPGGDGSVWTINVVDGHCDGDGTLVIPAEVEIDGKIYTVNGIADGAFKDRNDITRLVISSTIKEIGSESFAGCTSLTEVVIEDGLAVLSFGKDTFRDAPIEKVYFGRGSNEKASRTGARSMARLQAEESPFAGNLYLRHISIGEMVRYIADGMFDDCKSVETVEALGTVPPAISRLTFDEDTYHLAELRVQESAKSAYTNAEYWQDFDHIYSFGQIPVESITLNLESSEMKVGEEQTLSATVTPENATKADVEWTSSDEAVTTVNAEGKVKAVGAGKATITALTTDGSKLVASCTVTVTDPAGVNDIESDSEGVTVIGGSIMAPEGSEIFDATGRLTDGRNLSSGIYFVRTPKGKTVKVVI